MVPFQKFKNWLTAEDLLYHRMVQLAGIGVLEE